MTEEHPFGRYLEDFKVGDVYKHRTSKTVTEYDDHLFSMITMNHHPLHTNQHFAENATQFKRNVVVGNLIYSLATGISVPDISGVAIANLEIENLKHPAPVFHGDTIYVESEVLEITPSKSKPDRGVVKVKTIAYNQDGVVVCEYVRKVLIPTRASVKEDQPARPDPKLGNDDR
jgi:acyl dehydratase